jgi:hypothetical protein
VEKTTLLEICWPLRLPRHSIAYRLVRSDLPVRPELSSFDLSLNFHFTHSLSFIFTLPAGLCPDRARRPLQFTSRYYTLRIPCIQLEQPPGRATYPCRQEDSEPPPTCMSPTSSALPSPRIAYPRHGALVELISSLFGLPLHGLSGSSPHSRGLCGGGAAAAMNGVHILMNIYKQGCSESRRL